jgi:HJR/Mrr/RecB family endonuclease
MQAAVAEAEAELKAAEAGLATATAKTTRLAGELNVSKLVLRAWDAARQARQVLDEYEAPRVLPVALIPLPLTFLGFVFVVEASGLGRLGATGAVIVFVTTTAIATFLCVFPNDEVLQRQHHIESSKVQQISASLNSSQQQVTILRRAVAAATERLASARNSLIAAQLAQEQARDREQQREQAVRQSLEQRFQRLYSRPWKAMRAGEFESYLAEVLASHGYDVQETGQSGDQGVDLIAAKPGWRIAIQAKGYSGSVGNAAVQEAYAGMAHYGCDCCVVVTNSYYTSSAVSLAQSTRCLLIHEDNFKDFVFGRIVFTPEQDGSA